MLTCDFLRNSPIKQTLEKNCPEVVSTYLPLSFHYNLISNLYDHT